MFRRIAEEIINTRREIELPFEFSYAGSTDFSLCRLNFMYMEI